MQSRVPQRPVADDTHGRRHVWRDGFHGSVGHDWSQAGLSVQPMGDGRYRRHYRLCAQLLRLSRPSILHRSSTAGRTATLTDIQCVNNKYKPEIWDNAQRDGRPAEHRWRPLFNAAKFG